MFKKQLITILAILTLVMTSCAYRRAVPEQTPAPRQQQEQAEQEQEQEQTPAQRQEDKLAKSEMDSVEENINGVGIQEDIQITEAAETNEATQTRVGVNQQEAVQIRQAAGGSTLNTVLHEYRTVLPQAIQLGLQYDRYDLSYDYFLITSEEEVSIHANPDPNDTIICRAYTGEKLALHQRVRGEAMEDTDIWYLVSCKQDGEIKTGYIHSTAGIVRHFQFEKMLASLQSLLNQVAEGPLHHISNYKNINGAPPSKDDAATDEFGMRVYQSAPGYEEANTGTDFRYLPDGMLVRLQEETGDFYRVYSASFEDEYFVPKQYIDQDVTLDQLTHVVIVDRGQQNQAAFEITDNGIQLVSYTLATTGLRGDFSFETPLGYYNAIEKKERFEYLRDGTSEIAGYAPYAVRFTGGAYIHGVPVDYEEEDGEKIDPGIKEYLHTIGTFPRSHMCVRNFSSHAEFLYGWMNTDQGAIIVIE